MQLRTVASAFVTVQCALRGRPSGAQILARAFAARKLQFDRSSCRNELQLQSSVVYAKARRKQRQVVNAHSKPHATAS